MARGRPARKVKQESDKEDSDPEPEVSTNENDAEEKEVDREVKENPCLKKLFVVPKELESLGWDNISTVILPHPRTKNPALFLINGDDGENKLSQKFLFEILTLDQPCRSFFIDDEVVSDGNIRMVTPIDPLFILLPLLSQSTQARPISDHLCDHLPPKVVEIMSKKLQDSQLCQISIKKVAGDITAFAYSEDLAMSWIEKKVARTVAFLTEKNITRMESSISSNFTNSSAVKRDDKEYLRYACDIVGDYLESGVKKKLLIKVGLPAELDRKRRTNGVAGGPEDSPKKKQKVTAEEKDVQPLEDYSSPTSNANSTTNVPKGAKAKSLQKAAQGSHSLFKFFSPKS